MRFLFLVFLGFVASSLIIGGMVRLFSGRSMRPSLLALVVGWIGGFFLVGAVAFFPNLVVVFSHWPPTHGWNWLEGFVGVILIFRGRAYLRKSFTKKIPADPIYGGLVTVWGRRTDVIKQEGKPFLAPYWPFLIDVILIKLELFNLDKEFSDLSARTSSAGPGVTVSGRWSVNYIPDLDSGKSARNFLNAGKQKGINDVLSDIIPHALRRAVGDSLWDDITRGKGQVEDEVLDILVGRGFNRATLVNGIPDRHGLGIKIKKFLVDEVKLGGTARQAQDELAVQQIRRQSQKAEIKGVVKQLKLLIDAGVPADKALDTVNIRAGEVEKFIVEIQGLEGGEGGSGLNLMGLAGLLNVLGVNPQGPGKKRGGQKQGTQPKKGGKDKRVQDLRDRARRVL